MEVGDRGIKKLFPVAHQLGPPFQLFLSYFKVQQLFKLFPLRS